MPHSLPDLESRRADLVKQIARLGDLRSGSISDTSGRCGKPNCRCHQPDQPVHGPNLRLTYKDQGKTVTESIRLLPLRKRPSAKLASFATSSNSSARSLRSTPIRTADAKDFRRPAQERPTGSRGRGD